jgi:hypothetical protein
MADREMLLIVHGMVDGVGSGGKELGGDALATP